MAELANRAGFWHHASWASIDDGVAQSVGAICVVEKVFRRFSSGMRRRYPPTTSIHNP